MAERLALLGDVHANLPALLAVIDAVHRVGILRVACTGDLVMRGPEPEECVTLVRRRGWPCVRGNTDEKVAGKPRRDPDHPKAGRLGSRAWTVNRLSDESLAFLAELPLVLRLTLGGARVVVMHGGPGDTRDAVLPDSSDARLATLAARLEADCIVSAHTHAPALRRVDGCLFVNPGSVGEAHGEDTRPRWAWLEAGPDGIDAHLEALPHPGLARVRPA